MSAARSGTAERRDAEGPGADLLAALLDGMDAALCAFDADGAVTHWNKEAERILGWSAEEAVGRRGFEGWAARPADAVEALARLMAAMEAPGRLVNEFALVRKDGGRVLVRTQSAGVRGADGKPAGVYCAFSEVHAQIDLERSIALSEALFDDASWGVVLVDVDLRPTVVNGHAARVMGAGRTTLLGRPLGELIAQGVEELESALEHVLAEGAPKGAAEVWVTLRTPEGERRRCWRSGFVRLASPLAEEPVPLGVGWLFQDVTEERLAEQEADRLRFRYSQLHRGGAVAAECEDPKEAATVLLDFRARGLRRPRARRRGGGGAAARTGGGDADGRAGPGRSRRGRRHPAALPVGPPGPPGPLPYGTGTGVGARHGGPAGGRGLGDDASLAPGRGPRALPAAAQQGQDGGRGDVPALRVPYGLRTTGRGLRGGGGGTGRGLTGPGGGDRSGNGYGNGYGHGFRLRLRLGARLGLRFGMARAAVAAVAPGPSGARPGQWR